MAIEGNVELTCFAVLMQLGSEKRAELESNTIRYEEFIDEFQMRVIFRITNSRVTTHFADPATGTIGQLVAAYDLAGNEVPPSKVRQLSDVIKCAVQAIKAGALQTEEAWG